MSRLLHPKGSTGDALKARLGYAALALGTIPLGLLCRMARLGLPAGIVKYGGSALWAVMVYWLVSLLLARRPVVQRACAAAIVAAAVEFFKLVRDACARCVSPDAGRQAAAWTVLLRLGPARVRGSNPARGRARVWNLRRRLLA